MSAIVDQALATEAKKATVADIQEALWACRVNVAEFTQKLRSARLERMIELAVAGMKKAADDLAGLTAQQPAPSASPSEYAEHRRRWNATSSRFDRARQELDRLTAERWPEKGATP